MRAMIIDDEVRSQTSDIRKILRECRFTLDSRYEFVGVYGADDFCAQVGALTRPPDLAVIDYSLRWKDSNGDLWNGDRVAHFLREHWKDDLPFYILFVSAVLHSMDAPYDQLVSLLSVPYTGFVEFKKGWEEAFEAHVRCACDSARAGKDRAIGALNLDAINELFGEKIRGGAPSLLQAGHIAAQVSGTTATVLILGESGTGKEVTARAIHDNSPRRDRPFVVCPALPETLIESELFGHRKGAFTGANVDRLGYVEAANGGTLFLDEIGDLSLSVQPKILRLLQEREFNKLGETRVRKADIRIIAATHRNLSQMVADGTFREDLFSRLDVVSIHLPPLRDRSEDIFDLAEYFLERFAKLHGRHVTDFSPAAMRKLRSHSWPGNVRELEHAVERAVILCGSRVVEENDIMFSSVRQASLTSNDLFEGSWQDALQAFKKMYFEKKVQECNGNITRAAEKAGLQRESVHNLTKELGIHPRMKKS